MIKYLLCLCFMIPMLGGCDFGLYDDPYSHPYVYYNGTYGYWEYHNSGRSWVPYRYYGPRYYRGYEHREYHGGGGHRR